MAENNKVNNIVSKSVRKKDSMQLLLGKPLYTNDLAPEDCLIVKLLRSPHPHALVDEIDTAAASRVPGIEAIYTYKDVPQNRFTNAGQTPPEPSPHDRLILDRRLRFTGDPVAIVAGETEDAVDKALKLIKVKYEVLEPILDFHTSLDNEILVHPEDDWKSLCPVGADNKRNLVSHDECGVGDVEAVLADCDVVIDRVYHTKAVQQSMMETFRTFCQIDAYGRLHIVSSNQVIYHCRRIISNALGIPQSKIRVTKPRLGGGFGAKQTCVSEMYPAFVTWMTKKPSKILFSRQETQTASSPRHEMEMHVRMGADRDGIVRVIDLHTLSNTGAYGEHGPTTIGLSGHKSIPLYAKAEAFRFTSDCVYSNVMPAGAYRGYGATQGIFAMESAGNEMAALLGIDPMKFREMNIPHEGELLPAYYNEPNNSCALDRCVARVKEMINWDENFPVKEIGDDKVLAYGMSLAMQGSGISGMDVGGCIIKLEDGGFYTMRIGSADMGTGSDTILAQIAAEVLKCPLDNINVIATDTDFSPYDSGSYASSTTYVTGKAVEKASIELINNMKKLAAELIGDCEADDLDFDGEKVFHPDGRDISLQDLIYAAMNGHDDILECSGSNSQPNSPPPYMCGAVELEIDTYTGEAHVRNFKACVDCGTPINPALARVQTEGGIGQGIGMALTENITYNAAGTPIEKSFMQYKIPTRPDIGHIQVEFESSYEPTGPYGAKSIGEIVVNTPGPSIADAIYQATGKRFYELPITAEQIAEAFAEKRAREK